MLRYPTASLVLLLIVRDRPNKSLSLAAKRTTETNVQTEFWDFQLGMLIPLVYFGCRL